MASIIKRGDKYQAQIRRDGKSVSKSFIRKSDASAWARKVESEIERSVYFEQQFHNVLFSELLDRYKSEVLPGRVKDPTNDNYHIQQLKTELGNLPLKKFTADILSKYRDKRLQSIQVNTFKRELAMVSRVLNTAMKEWNINPPHGNPVPMVRLPRVSDARDRRPTEGELEILSSDKVVGKWVRFAVATGMRRGEIVNVKAEHLSEDGELLLIPETKTGVPRTIPLTQQAQEALDEILAGSSVKPHAITTAFMRACKKNMIKGLRFHDLRHEATSRLFEIGLNPVEVASISGHADTKMLMRYTHLSPKHLGNKIALLSKVE